MTVLVICYCYSNNRILTIGACIICETLEYIHIAYCECCIASGVHGQQQYFRIEPRDVRVHEGGEALLECQVANQAGQVQWTKDGFALGEYSIHRKLTYESIAKALVLDRYHRWQACMVRDWRIQNAP